MSTENTDQTSVEEVEIDINDILDFPVNADNVMVPEKKPNMFDVNTPENLDFLNESTDDEKPASAELNEILDIGLKPEVEDEEGAEPNKPAGRPKTEKSALVGFLKKRIESDEMFTFDDFDESKQSLDDYLASLSEKDVEELWTANITQMKEDVAKATPEKFFESLPEELQFAAKYVMDGGQDLKGLFQALSSVQQSRDLDPADDNDGETIIRQYLQATNYGTPEDIDEEITTWKDLGVLQKKAAQFKPKLDAMHEERVQATIQEQEARKAQQQAAAQKYVDNVFESLRTGEINGLKLEKKIQSQLYAGLTQAQYPSISGRPTNLLGHLLEKYQFVEPNHSLIAEALYLLSNPEDYRNNIMKMGENKATEETVRKLKTAQSDKSSSSSADFEDKTKSTSTGPRKIPRQTNIFKRI